MGATLHRIGSVEADDPTLNHGGMIPHIYTHIIYIHTYIYIQLEYIFRRTFHFSWHRVLMFSEGSVKIL